MCSSPFNVQHSIIFNVQRSTFRQRLCGHGNKVCLEVVVPRPLPSIALTGRTLDGIGQDNVRPV